LYRIICVYQFLVSSIQRKPKFPVQSAASSPRNFTICQYQL